MEKYFCYGKKDFCESSNQCSSECPHYDGTGGSDLDVPPTNADRIRAMDDEELEVFIEQIIPINCDCCVYMKLCRLEYDEETVNYAEKYSCRDGIMKWLKQPAERFGQKYCPDQMEDDHA